MDQNMQLMAKSKFTLSCFFKVFFPCLCLHNGLFEFLYCRYAGEIHLVHIRDKYKDIHHALNQTKDRNAILVIGIMMEVSLTY